MSVSTLTTMTSTISDPDNDNDDEILQNIPCRTKQEQYYYQTFHTEYYDNDWWCISRQDYIAVCIDSVVTILSNEWLSL